MIQVSLILTFDLLTLKSTGINYRQWQTKTPIVVSLSLIGFMLLSGQEFNVPGHCDLVLWPTDPLINRDCFSVIAN